MESRRWFSAGTDRCTNGWVVTNCYMELVGRQDLVSVGGYE